MKKFVLIGLALVIGASVLWGVLPAGFDLTQVRTAGSAQAKEDHALPVASVLAVRPGVGSASATPPAETPKPSTISFNVSQFRARKDYPALYQRLQGDSSAEGLYLKALVYKSCARQDGKSAQELVQERAAARAKFIASISQDLSNAAQQAKRADAFDQLTYDPCTGLDLGAFNNEEFARMLAGAAAAGDIRAQALQLADRVERGYQENQGQTRYQLNEADFDQARQLLASGDPAVIWNLQGILSSTLEAGGIRLAGEPINNSAMFAALGLLACDAGGQCGPESSQILRSCAYEGQCSANNLYEYSYYYQFAPAQSQMVDSYRQTLLTMLNAHDFSGLTYSPSDVSSGYAVTFGRTGPPGG